jgi:hypothetical protein
MANCPDNLDILKDYNKKLVRLSSSTRTNNNKSYDERNSFPTSYQISFTSTGQELNKIKKISLIMFSTNNMFYNVASYNNTMQISYSGSVTGLFLVSVPVGYYNATQLATVITSYVVANCPDLPQFVCTFDVNTYKFSLNSGNSSILLTITDAIVNPSTRQYINTLAYNMGYTYFPYGAPPSITALQVLTANTLPTLNIQNIYIFSDKLASAKSFRSDSSNRSIQGNELLNVSLATTPYGATINYTSTDAGQKTDIIYPIELQLDTIDIQLLNDSGNVLECDYNNNNVFEFMIYY